MTSLLTRALGKLVTLREGEAATALLMFAYSFLAMTAYNIVKPITRSKFISDLGADNLPYVQLGGGRPDRRPDAALQRRRSRGCRAAAVIPVDAGRRGRAAGAVLVSVPNRRRVGVGGVLRARAHPRHPADQPVLDARQRHLRCAPGQAAVRLHRRRRQPGRRDGRGDHRVRRREGRHQQPAARERGDVDACASCWSWRSCGARTVTSDVAAAGRGTGRRRRRSDPAAALVAAACRSSRS